ncbi:hypothetical protein BT69DRAFT_1331705 [Atractiella rhizophila]|nr:hypothetical protein BT69DRAFT_1331705 [Atractiella rhizophila]
MTQKLQLSGLGEENSQSDDYPSSKANGKMAESKEESIGSAQSTGDTPASSSSAEPVFPSISRIFGSKTNPGIVIEYCTGCRWFHRSSWTVTELSITFPEISSFSLLPKPEESGCWRVWITHFTGGEEGSNQGEMQSMLIWDRKGEGRFPEMKELKQRIRNVVDPERSLGHSDQKK